MSELVLALDLPHSREALEMADLLKKDLNWVKVGLELFCNSGPQIITALAQKGFSVFLDLKFLDIPNTVYRAVHSAGRAGAQMLTLHLTGGQEMVKMAIKAKQELLDEQFPPPLLLGVTLLTSLSAQDLPWPDTRPLSRIVLDLAEKGKNWGVDGVVCSAWESNSVKEFCGQEFLCLTPGIRIQPTQDDQHRVMTPEDAVQAGSDFLVVGRPITQASNPPSAVQDIQKRILQAKESSND